MRRTPFVVALIVCAIVGFAPLGAAAQDATRPVVLNVTMSAAGDLLTIVGTGFGTAPLVTIDGQATPVLPGASDTQITVVTPAALLTTPGSYRLTVVDSVRASRRGVRGDEPRGAGPGRQPDDERDLCGVECWRGRRGPAARQWCGGGHIQQPTRGTGGPRRDRRPCHAV